MDISALVSAGVTRSTPGSSYNRRAAISTDQPTCTNLLFMHTGKAYKLSEFILWTRRDIYILLVLGSVPVIAYELGKLTWLAIPWQAVALLGTATAFVVGFKNVQTYNRAWE